jgi:hypothetical protein
LPQPHFIGLIQSCRAAATHSGVADDTQARKRPNYRRHKEEARTILARNVYERLGREDKYKADRGDAKSIKWASYGDRGWPSPLSETAKYAKATHPDLFANCSHKSLKITAKKWFIAESDERRKKDLPRLRKLDIDEDDFRFLRDVLIDEGHRWEDAAKNKRRHCDLQAARDYWLAREDAGSQQHLARLSAICAAARIRNLRLLTAKVREQFNLRLKKEKFKEARDRGAAQAASQRMLTQKPMVEVLTTGKKTQWVNNEPKPPPADKVIRYRIPLPPHLALHSGEEFEQGPLYYGKGAHHITAAIDGASVFASGDIRFDARNVHYDVRPAHCCGLSCVYDSVHMCTAYWCT